MSIWSTIKRWFGVAEKEVKTVVETKVEPVVTDYIKHKIQEIDVEKATKAIETRLAEIAEEKKAEAKVTAKEIKAKVKKAVTEEKPAKVEKPAKAKPAKQTAPKTEKPATKPAKTSRKKTDK